MGEILLLAPGLPDPASSAALSTSAAGWGHKVLILVFEVCSDSRDYLFFTLPSSLWVKLYGVGCRIKTMGHWLWGQPFLSGVHGRAMPREGRLFPGGGVHCLRQGQLFYLVSGLRPGLGRLLAEVFLGRSSGGHRLL